MATEKKDEKKELQDETGFIHTEELRDLLKEKENEKNCLGIRDGLVKEKNKSKMEKKEFRFLKFFLFYSMIYQYSSC